MKRISRKRFPHAWVLLALVAASGCGSSNTRTCANDDQCPTGQRCLGETCQVPGDNDIRTCSDDHDCKANELCRQGVCSTLEQDGGEDGGGGDGDNNSDQQPPRDFSNLRFVVAVVLDGSSGPASQCVTIQPAISAGPVLPDITLASGYLVSGVVKDGNGQPISGAQMTIVADTPECLPPAQRTNQSGAYQFYLPGNQLFRIQAMTSAGLFGYAQVHNLLGNATMDVALPQTQEMSGGPLTDDNNRNVNGETVLAYFSGGPWDGLQAHRGVVSGPPSFADGEFTLALSQDASQIFSLFGYRDAGSAYPRQLLWDGIRQGSYLGSHRLKMGAMIKGQVTTNSGAGVPDSVLQLVQSTDSRLFASTTAGAAGGYQVTVSPGNYDIIAIPSQTAFAQGATRFVKTGLGIYDTINPTALDVGFAQGEQVTFSGKVKDSRGSPVTGAKIRLMLSPAVNAAGNDSLCDPTPSTSANDGSYQATCNLLFP